MRTRALIKAAPLLIAVAGLCALLVASTDAGAARGGKSGDDTVSHGLSQGQAGKFDDTLIVRFEAGVAPGQAKQLLDSIGATVKKERGRSRLQVLQLPAGSDLDAALQSLRSSGIVDVAGFDYIATAFDAPNDPDYPDQWHLHDTVGGIWAESAWDLAPTAGAGVVVAVIDTGAAFETFDAPPVLFSPRHFEPAPDLAGVPIVAPWNFLTDTMHANDDHGHGTHVSGTILQATNNHKGVAGVANGASLMPLKILDYSGSGSTADLVEAIYYAVDNGARVINMSLGFSGTGEPDAYGQVCAELPGLNDALDYAFDHGVTIVAAAGNEGASQVACPAAYPSVISVGATRYDGQTTFYSNSGFALDITAPGGDPNVDQDGNGSPDGVLQQTFCADAFTLLITGDYSQFCSVYMPGTSMASPHVAGTAALLLGENAALTPLQVRYYLETTARDRGAPGRDDQYGWGALDAHAALAALQAGPPPDITPTPTPAPPPQTSGPAAPTALTATALSRTSIVVTWQDNATTETGYKVERRIEGGEFAQVATLGAGATTWTSTALAAGTSYDFRVRAYDATGDSRYSNVATATTLPPPAAPSGLTATPLSPGSINLTWTDNSDDEQGFRVERSTDGVYFFYVTNAPANATSYTVQYLKADTTYMFRVRAFESTSFSPWSNVATATTLPPPPAPTNLVATAVNASSVTLSWTDNATTETAYRIERSTNGVNFGYAGQVGANVTTFTNLYLQPATTYWYRVAAVEGSAFSDYSDTSSATTFPPPAAPSNLAATSLSNTSIRLTWTDNSTSESGFRVERSTDGVSFSYAGQVGANVTTFDNKYLTAGASYWYRVRAYEGSVYSDYSNVATNATLPPPAAPSNLVATTVSNSTIHLTWTDNSASESGFRIERSSDGVSFSYSGQVGAGVTVFDNNYLTAGTTYWYRVLAQEGSVYSDPSNVSSATTLPPPAAPSNLAAATLSSSSIRLTWTDNSASESGFRIERSTNGVNFSYAGQVGAGVTTFDNNYLAPETTYWYRVSAQDGSVYSDPSNVASATTLPPPATPSNLDAAALSNSSIRLTWNDNSTSESGFRVERSTDGVSFSYVTNVGAGVTSYDNNYLAPDTTYWYRVRAYEGSVYSDYSNVASATTLPPPAAPSNLVATALSNSSIRLTWTDNSTSESGFRVERSTDGVSFSYVTNVGANTTSYDNLYLSASATYYYRIRAYEGSASSDYSNVASATTLPPPAAPSNLSAEVLSSTSVQLTWTDNSTSEYGFKIERSTNGGASWSLVGIVGANGTSWTNNNLASGTTYSYRVRAYEGSVTSDPSNTVTVTP